MNPYTPTYRFEHSEDAVLNTTQCGIITFSEEPTDTDTVTFHEASTDSIVTCTCYELRMNLHYSKKITAATTIGIIVIKS